VPPATTAEVLACLLRGVGVADRDVPDSAGEGAAFVFARSRALLDEGRAACDAALARAAAFDAAEGDAVLP